MRQLLIILFFLPLYTKSQVIVDNNVKGQAYKGIHWAEGLSWAQVKEKASKENKYIFVDCYTTWCGPCKSMDKEVYPQEKVGTFFNDKFISVKVQMDKTPSDNEITKMWYVDAKKIMTDYGVAAFPTLLFFSPTGDPMHKVVGGYNVDGLISMAKESIDPEKQYYKKLLDYKSGKTKLSSEEMQLTALELKESGFEMAELIAMDYLNKTKANGNYNNDDLKFMEQFWMSLKICNLANEYIGKLKKVDLLSNEKLEFVRIFSKSPQAQKKAAEYINSLTSSRKYTRENLEFVRSFTKKSSDKGFDIYYKHSKDINSIMGFDNAQDFISSIIKLENVYPIVKHMEATGNSLIDWDGLSANIEKRYGTYYANRVITDEKIIWFQSKGDLKSFTMQLLIRLEINAKSIVNDSSAAGLHVSQINDPCFYIFLYSNVQNELVRASYWMEQLFIKQKGYSDWPTTVDTYANLLYKLGRVKEAIAWEVKAVRKNPDNPEMSETLSKMLKGLPTWSMSE